MIESLKNLFVSLPDWPEHGIQFGTGVLLLVLGGNWLVHGAVTVARRLGMPILLIGLTIVAAGTSAPELAFNLSAALAGVGEMCFGNVIGSNIANIGLVLGVCAVMRPLNVHSTVVRRELPWLLGISGFMFLMALLPTSGVRTGQHLRGFGVIDGAVFLIGFVLVIGVWYRRGRKHVRDPLVKEVAETAEAEAMRSLSAAAGVLFGGFVALWVGGALTKEGAVGIARLAGLSDVVIGFTIVAISTSLPEVITSIVAVRKGHTDLAVGNVVGSNLFNILFVLGVTTLFAPVPLPHVWGWYDLFFMFVITAALFPIARLGNTRNSISRAAGILLLVFYVIYLTFVVLRDYFDWADDVAQWLRNVSAG